MSENYQRIDARIYGGIKDVSDLVDLSTNAAQAGTTEVPLAANVSIGAVGPATLAAQGEAQLKENNRVPATALESMGAAMDEWLPKKLYKAATAPDFPWDKEHQPLERLNQETVQYSTDEYNRLLETKNGAEYDFLKGNIDEQKELRKIAGDHSLLAGIVSFADPVYLGISIASLGVGAAAKAAGVVAAGQRVAAGGAAFSTTLAVGKAEQSILPISDTAIWANALMFGAAEGLLYRAGKLVKSDPNFPGDQLHKLAAEIEAVPRMVQQELHPDFIGPAQVHPEPGMAPLTESRVPATGEGSTPVTYSGGAGANDVVGDYNPNMNLSRAEQVALHTEGRVGQVKTVAEIADQVDSVRLGRTVIDPDAKAVYLPAENRVFLITDNIKPTDDMKGIILHEVGVHMNAERVLGVEKLGKMLSHLEDLALAGNRRAKQAFADVPSNTPRHLVREEALGYYVERNHAKFGDTFVSRMVAGVRAVLRDIGVSGLKYSENDLIQLVRKAAKGTGKKSSFDTTFPFAWHGSPVSGINKLDTAYMGTGEGKSAFGYGHYVSSEKGTALDYRNKESIRRGMDPEKGGLYRTKINAKEHEFLNLDGREQSATVRVALDKLGVGEAVTGKTAYDYLTKKLGSQKAASDALYALGVKGNRYATGRTRNASTTSSNYVLFHNDVVDIGARYSKGHVVAPQVVHVSEGEALMGGGHPEYPRAALSAALQEGKYTAIPVKGGELRLVNMQEAEHGAVVAFDKNGNEVGTLSYTKVEEPDGTRHNPDVSVEPEYQRQGVATAMYDIANQSGAKIPDVGQAGQVRTEAGAAFRDNTPMYSKPLPPTAQQATQQATKAMDKAFGSSAGRKLEWSLSKSLRKLGASGEEVSKLLVDDALDKSGDAASSQIRAIRADLSRPQYVFEDSLSKRMAELGGGTFKRIQDSLGALKVQRGIEREVYAEMARRADIHLDGGVVSHAGIPVHVKKMADELDTAYAAGLDEQVRAGVFGTEDIKHFSGYVPRRGDITKIEDIQRALVAKGSTPEAAKQTVIDAISISVQRANGWDADVGAVIGRAWYDRVRAKGYFEDSAFSMGLDGDGLREIRTILEGSGAAQAQVQKVMEKLTGHVDEAGKASALKGRIKMKLDEPIGDSGSSVMDLLDTGIATLTEKSLDAAAAQAGFARKGLKKSSDIQALRKKFLEDIPDIHGREQGADLFDNTIAALRGEPVGERMPAFMRNSLALTQMVGLGRAGLFQVTEYATMMAQYGATSTVGQMMKEMPFVRSMFNDSLEAGHLRNVLSGNASQDMRIRPFITRLEDNFEIPASDALQLSAMQAKQLIPYANAMKYIQGHQARVAGNLIVNTFERAANGELKALAALEHYGLESHIMAGIRQDIKTNGMNTSKWSDATWDAVRGPLTKMMDDSVLRSRTGEIPAFAQFSSTGKFIFTFRSFVLGAHNKVLAGTLHNKGLGGIGLMLAYQIPMMYAMTAVSNTVSGKKPMTEAETIGAAFSQAGALGLLGEVAGVAFSNKQQFGSPGTIAFDRVYKLAGSIAQGAPGEAAANTLALTPLLGSFLPAKALGEALKGN